jgi:hypothetical protein
MKIDDDTKNTIVLILGICLSFGALAVLVALACRIGGCDS